jgi:hypothetical protein
MLGFMFLGLVSKASSIRRNHIRKPFKTKLFLPTVLETVSGDTLQARRRSALGPHAVCMSPSEGARKDCSCSHWTTAWARLDRLVARVHVQLQREPVHLQQNNTLLGKELKGNLGLRQLNSAAPFYKFPYIISFPPFHTSSSSCYLSPSYATFTSFYNPLASLFPFLIPPSFSSSSLRSSSAFSFHV